MKALLALTLAAALVLPASAGGPLTVQGAWGSPGTPVTWDSTVPVQYRVDNGTLGKLSSTEAVAAVDSMFAVWQNIPTANLGVLRVGPLLSHGAFTDGDANTMLELDALFDSCINGVQSPIIFDADARILQEMGYPPGVIGFSGWCLIDNTLHYKTNLVLMNGAFLDGSTANGELTRTRFDAAFIHEFGHMLGLDHSQINVVCLNACGGDNPLGVPTMFPVAVSDEMRSLSEDDIAWFSWLYPETQSNGTTQRPFSDAYGIVSGNIVFADGSSPLQGVNIIARKAGTAAEARRFAISVVSGFLYTGDPTANPNNDFGSRDPRLMNYFELPLPPGTYTLEVESLDPGFVDGSSVGPIAEARGRQIPAPGPIQPVTITSIAGTRTPGVTLVINSTHPRFDAYESE